jgi:ABC-type phosphate transport system substrate-binding protein
VNVLSLSIASLLLAAPVQTKAQTEQFVVIVNAVNPESSADAETLAAVFLKQRKKWKNGESILPVDHSVVSPIRSLFATEVFGQQASALQAYWEGEVVAGRNSPPPVRDSDEQVLAFVSANPGAVGYVDRAAKLSPNVKVLRFVR